MPMYTYRCPACHAPATRIVRRSEADEQRCEALLEAEPKAGEPGPGIDGASTISICGTKLVRPEVELTARTPEAWRT